MQHKLYVEEMQALKEVRRSDKAQQIASIKKIDECIVMLDKKIKLERLEFLYRTCNGRMRPSNQLSRLMVPVARLCIDGILVV